MDIIVYPPTINWTFMKQRPQQLMKKFADSGYKVFYCNKTQTAKDIEEIAPNLYIVHNHEHWLKETLPKARKNKKVGIWCSWSKLANTLNRYKPDWIIYDCVDEFADWIKYEPEMVNMADAVVCTAERLKTKLQNNYPTKRIELIRNAYDQDMGLHMNPVNKNIKAKKKIGYIGAWAPWIDDELITRLARTLKYVEMEIIGIEFGKKFNLHHIPNIKFLGHKPHSELPNFLKNYSLCIIPFRINPITLATNPVKMYEYLATGHPVVSTNLPECYLAQPYVDVANNHVDFINKVRNRLQNPGNSLERKQFALNNTWSHRVNQAIHLIRDISK